MAKKKHKTPERLDYLFERKVVTKANYVDFWSGYWGESSKRAKDRYVDKFVSEVITDLPDIRRRKSGTVIISIRAAKEQAREIGGYVVRRNSRGRFSKTGRHYQAVVRRKKK